MLFRSFGTKNLNEQSNPIQYLNHIIDFDVNDLGDVERQTRLGKELYELDKIVDTNENIPDQVAKKIFELGDFYIGKGGIADASGFHEYLNKYRKLLSKYTTKNLKETNSITESEESDKNFAEYVFKSYLEDAKQSFSAAGVAYMIMMDTDSKIPPRYIKHIMKKYHNIDLK
mgnify:FL=1